ncbi:signal transduction histidine kinase [Allocatelliglobosispora scoriae]|uniref:histidine kinase n=1 Tax=Allocatelliglobosispora scoriae TaxID=643052 RepID=A0A841BIS6_9ACTN|nr:HAMP domain-containing sensor histidine kinase [Allocatelliglobosispora scoriae]MBB5867515.1 signal transduction histidine kinase [Allocatelliglobosispora scoriae]
MTYSSERLQRSWRSRLGGVRVRSALAAAGIVAAAVGLAGLALVYTAETTLTGNIDAAASQRAGQVVAAIKAGDPTRLAQTLRTSAGDQTIVQIINPAGEVVASSAVLAGQRPITAMRPAAGASQWEQRLLSPDSEDPFRIVATGVETDSSARVVVVAQSVSPVNESIEVITRWVIVAMPLLALVVGLATYVFVGRSLRPVEAIRRRVATITGRDLDARVPVPSARDEVAALAETMNEMLDRLQAAADTQRRFVADASHELRSPLTTLQVGLDLLAGSADTSRPQIQRMQAETERLSRLVADLLLLARVDEYGLTLRRNDVDLDDLAYAHRDRIHEQHPQLRINAEIEPVRVPGDVHQLDRAIRNLCDNAARHARHEINLTVRADGGTAHVIVADDGPGIDPADRERVFDRFTRLDDSRARTDGGAGLGLPITREIVNSHGGSVVAETFADSGVALHIRLPLDPDKAPGTGIAVEEPCGS